MGIEISIKAGADTSTSSVSASGSEQHIITDKERKTFDIEDSGLKNAVEKYFGKKPNDAYLHSPTPWDDLYKTYGWSEVQTILDVKSSKVTEITSEPVIVATKKFVNSSTKIATFDASISDQVNNTTESNWSQTDTIEVGRKITYSVSFLGTGAGGETSMTYSHSWGQGGSESKSITVGSSSGVSVELGPGESVEAVLTASRGVMKVRIVYMAHLTGSSAVNYNPTYKDHHFWSLPITGVMGAASLSTTREFTEDIEIGYYSDAKIELRDPAGQLKATFLAANRPAVEKIAIKAV